MPNMLPWNTLNNPFYTLSQIVVGKAVAGQAFQAAFTSPASTATTQQMIMQLTNPAGSTKQAVIDFIAVSMSAAALVLMTARGRRHGHRSVSGPGGQPQGGIGALPRVPRGGCRRRRGVLNGRTVDLLSIPPGARRSVSGGGGGPPGPRFWDGVYLWGHGAAGHHGDALV